ncbi:MAG TPA: precorrin-6y C5,15-methyltransferase (decarboxylating) subunit CbiE [Acidimicrobiales bacterium]|nr:precorrin-6y C5,15-methyltransferase (decarboxylating) subunit CbiE [Acidimicrobiales bacterium]
MAEPAPVTVIGLADDRLDLLSPEAKAALAEASMVVGGQRQLDRWSEWSGAAAGAVDVVTVGADTDEVARQVRQRAVDLGRPVCVLASGDPGFFGIERALLRSIDRSLLRIVPAPSSISLAFARLGLPWDDAVVVSAHGRSLADATGIMRMGPKVAVLTSPESPPEAVGQALVRAGASMDLVAVCSRLGTLDEQVAEMSLEELAAGRFPPLSVVVLVGPGGLPLVGWGPGGLGARPTERVLAWGLPDTAFAHRAGMITKSDVRAVVLARLALPGRGVLWDVGAGSGSVGVEAALIEPGLTVLAVESSPEAAAQVSANAATLGAGVHVVTGHAPEVLDRMPEPDRAFVGGGGLDVLHRVVERLRPGGRVVATFAAVDRAAAAADLLGHLSQISASRGERLPDGGWRLAAENPVFVAWGPGDDGEPPA